MNARDHVSDADVLTAVRDSLSGMPLASPPDVETIMARGRRTRRHRRLIPGVSGTLAVAAGAALAVVLAEASRPLTSAQNKVTCAWPFEKVDAATEAPSRRSSAARAEWRITLRDEHGSGPGAQVAAFDMALFLAGWRCRSCHPEWGDLHVPVRGRRRDMHLVADCLCWRRSR